jgi:hypothetical protein
VNTSTTAHAPELMQNIQSSEIFVDEEGDWFNEGIAISREDIVQFFLENVQELPDGSYLIVWGDCRCTVRVADSPFLVSRVDLSGGMGEGPDQVLLKLKHLPQPVILDPQTLFSGSNNVLYCRVHESKHRARFSRPAYYQLAQWIDEDPETEGFCLKVGENRFPIRMEP